MSTSAEMHGDLIASGIAISSQSREPSREERRRNQNRVNQQAWRQRRRDRRAAEQLARTQQLYREQATAAVVPASSTDYVVPDLSSLLDLIRGESQYDRSTARDCQLTHPGLSRLLSVFEAAAYQSYRGNPRADHRLTLVKLNVFRAFVCNITALGYTREGMTDDSLSRFSINGPQPASTPAESIPASLQPTALQRSQPHHPWLDFFPFARLRDKLIQYEDYMDESQFCRDLMGFWTMPDEDNCIIVWGDPWDPMNWEITETFLQKWGRLVKECPEIMWSTNYWRHVRGEKRLTWRASFDQLRVLPVHL
ncbi:hypothetical protein ASPWEDRAFT_177609 [Aspergillus wentii DTO 134E9]|uniref:BZIP domain-containing protein n=1 Tax=Aspergillus wentii DTO 134E9 TaxID=1073089 RepID=A0A1L9R4N4_ASPWE|nr:uncharacterized protein ASPWEDRAFT_177609 [Aspergillus wentii DTO 134E9]OJJ29876.1 hypothetical protein ASPWEDRAFT_177609 [Aspergillus wentii DTO 134E9]